MTTTERETSELAKAIDRLAGAHRYVGAVILRVFESSSCANTSLDAANVVDGLYAFGNEFHHIRKAIEEAVERLKPSG